MNGLPAWRALALATAEEAGRLLASGASRRVNATTDDDVKMQADVDSETLVRERLAASGLPVIGEELGGDPALFESGDEPYWVVDPLDGTYNYLRNQPCTCVSIGLMRGKEPLLGVLRDFTADKTYLGVPGEGTTVNGRRVSPAWATRAARSMFIVSSATPAPATSSSSRWSSASASPATTSRSRRRATRKSPPRPFPPPTMVRFLRGSSTAG